VENTSWQKRKNNDVKTSTRQNRVQRFSKLICLPFVEKCVVQFVLKFRLMNRVKWILKSHFWCWGFMLKTGSEISNAKLLRIMIVVMFEYVNWTYVFYTSYNLFCLCPMAYSKGFGNNGPLRGQQITNFNNN